MFYQLDWIQFIIFTAGVFGCFFWNRAESRADARHMDQKLDAIRQLTYSFMQDSLEERKDFHGRLCSIEERSRGLK